MKTAYELAMERLNKTSPGVRLSDEQKRRIADLDTLYKSRIAEREIAMKDHIASAATEGNAEKLSELEQRLTSDRKKLQQELDEKKERVRQGRD